MRQIIFDTETTGLDPAQGHRIVEIGCVEIVNRGVTGRNLHIYLNPDRGSDPEALAVHGLTTEFLSDKPRFGEVAAQFLAFIDGAELIAHNAGFDVKFFNAELQKAGLKTLDNYCGSVVDSLAHARTLYPGKRNSLDALCDRYGISNAHRTLHGALLDSQLLAEVWLAMTRGQDALLIDVDDAQGGGGSQVELSRFDASVLPVIAASAEDLAAHEAYLAALDKSVGAACLWRTLDEASGAPAQAA
ncbi:DNA polymerase III subunit epsilon [Bordetella holmesii]|uniref:DNA polymerase III subunit epsilon n=2 Tax=Bordetella holmesii TaxID=35814 RepID=A0A158LZX0_9BORD|nr:DNA polymerase III subunit epsilon [Bordetella holmesii]AHV92939.1 DNA polymerase III, epsilon subunit [Bordetella holmesii ATCC 51541]AIT26740.1 DNA polymerase III, epsilon subunit [Bordetella holmesii 44057]EWM43984.1 DNA polymerase III, epsilon subunit [Bordetella holmesii 41130]EWM47329.1 DNA polymerase III, epsilon subunit [Bordetella holmesii 35009]EWM51485.1 DNA polymerase III, epsilon subunit [Bordetella holmesii 70147]